MLNYNELYTELGNLFYAMTMVDGKINPKEKTALQKLVNFSWEPMENSKDFFGTDAANIILFQFDVNEELGATAEDRFQSFAKFYLENAEDMNPFLRDKILHSARTIAESSYAINDTELEMIMRLRHLMATKAVQHKIN